MSERYGLYDSPVLYLFYQVLPEEERFLNCQYIHPLKQRALAETIEKAKAFPNVTHIVVFGSALTERCWDGSDLDIVVWDKTHTFRPPCSDDYDMFYADEIKPSDAIYEDVVERGVVVYARDNAGDFEIRPARGQEPIK